MTAQNTKEFAVFTLEVAGEHKGRMVFCFWTDAAGAEFWRGGTNAVIHASEMLQALPK